MSIAVSDRYCYFYNNPSTCGDESQAGIVLAGTIEGGVTTEDTQYYLCVCTYVDPRVGHATYLGAYASFPSWFSHWYLHKTFSYHHNLDQSTYKGPHARPHCHFEAQ